MEKDFVSNGLVEKCFLEVYIGEILKILVKNDYSADLITETLDTLE